MTAKLGTFEFTAHIGEPPRLPQPQVEVFARPGIAGTGAKIHAAMAPPFTLTLAAHGLDSWRNTATHSYRAAVGSILQLILGGYDFRASQGFDFLVLDVEIVESQAIPAWYGRNYAGTSVAYSPAGRIVTRWHLMAVPV